MTNLKPLVLLAIASQLTEEYREDYREEDINHTQHE